MSESEKKPLDVTGGCQCGAVRYTAKTDSNEAYYCHCAMCRRAFGNVFATFVNLPKASVVWEKEPDRFASSRIAKRGFCSKCGTPLTFEYNDSKRLDLAVGSLDHPELLKPVMHVGVEARLSSFAFEDGLPTKRMEEFQHIGAKWRAAYGEDVVPGPRSPEER